MNEWGGHPITQRLRHSLESQRKSLVEYLINQGKESTDPAIVSLAVRILHISNTVRAMDEHAKEGDKDE